MQKLSGLFVPYENSCLVVIDIQEKLLRVINKNESVLRESVRAIKIANALNLPVVLTEQLPDKIGKTVNEILDNLKDYNPIEKSSFSCLAEPAFKNELKSKGIKNLILCGIETHVCVLQTALDGISLGYNVYLIENACGSRKDNDKKIALDRVKKAGVNIITVEMMAFELMKDARHENFREVSGLVK